MELLIICHKDRRWMGGTSVSLVNGIIRRKHFIGSKPFTSANVVSMLKVLDPARATFEFVGRYMESFGN